MPEITILPATSEKKPLELRTEWNEVGDANARLIKARRDAQRLNKPMPVGVESENPVPWVQVGSVYLSLFETGENSWKPIVTSLATGSGAAKLFTILTGRHGSNIHETDSSGQFTGVKDSSHLTQDLQKVSDLKGKLPPNVDMMVLDVTDPDFNTERRMREAIRQNVAAGRVVILAWCFSIYVFKGVPEDSTLEDINKKYPGLVDMTIKKIVQDDWTPV